MAGLTSPLSVLDTRILSSFFSERRLEGHESSVAKANHWTSISLATDWFRNGMYRVNLASEVKSSGRLLFLSEKRHKKDATA